MSEVILYKALERMVKAAEANDIQEVVRINKEFSQELDNQYTFFRNDKRTLMYDCCANSAVYSVTQQPRREEHLQRMKEIFSKLG